MRRPKDQTRSSRSLKSLANLGDAMATAVETAKDIAEMDDSFDPTAPTKASNVLLPSERKPVVVVKKSRKEPGQKASEKPTEAPTAEEAKPATPVAKKAKKAPAPKPEEPKKPLIPEGTDAILKDGEIVGYLAADGAGFYDAYTLEDKRLTFGGDPAKTKANFLTKLRSYRPGQQLS